MSPNPAKLKTDKKYPNVGVRAVDDTHIHRFIFEESLIKQPSQNYYLSLIIKIVYDYYNHPKNRIGCWVEK